MEKAIMIFLAFLMALSHVPYGGSKTAINHTQTLAEQVEVYQSLNRPITAQEATIEDYFRILTKDQRKALIQNQNDSQNHAEYLIADGWIYGFAFDRNDQSSLVKWRTNLSDKTILTKGFATNLYLKDAFLYCMLNQGKEKGIYRMRVSGDGVEKLSNAYEQMQIWDKIIYYSDKNRDYHLYKMNLDGSGEKEVIKKAVFHWYVMGDYILYQDDADGESLHLMKIGGKDVKLNHDRSYWPIYDGEYIYYVKAKGEERSIWRINIDGTKDTKLANYHVSGGFVMYEDKLYFIYRDDSDRIYSINKDGSGLQLISQDKNCQFLQFMGDILKYDAVTYSGNQVYLDAVKLCKPDGTLLYTLVD